MLPRRIERIVFGFFAVLPILALMILPLTENFRRIENETYGFAYHAHDHIGSSEFPDPTAQGHESYIPFRFASGGKIWDTIIFREEDQNEYNVFYANLINDGDRYPYYDETPVYYYRTDPDPITGEMHLAGWQFTYQDIIPLEPFPAVLGHTYDRNIDYAYHSIELIVPLIPTFALTTSMRLADSLGVSSLFAIIVAWVLSCFMLQMIIEVVMCVPRMCSYLTAKMLNRHYKEEDIV